MTRTYTEHANALNSALAEAANLIAKTRSMKQQLEGAATAATAIEQRYAAVLAEVQAAAQANPDDALYQGLVASAGRLSQESAAFKSKIADIADAIGGFDI